MKRICFQGTALIAGLVMSLTQAAPAHAERDTSPAPRHGMLAEQAMDESPRSGRAAAVGASDDRKQPRGKLTLYVDNDTGGMNLVDDSDRWYSNGAALGYTHQPDWAARLAEALPFQNELGQPKDRAGAGYIVGQLMFTPEDITQSAPQPNDRPFVGYNFLGAYWQRANAHTLEGVQVDVGFVGNSTQADAIQELIHDLFGGDDPNGWPNQVEDEPTAQVFLRKKWKWRAWQDDDSTLALQVLPYGTLALGTVNRSLELGGDLRIGWRLPEDFGPGRLLDPLDAVSGTPDGKWHAYGFLGGSVRVVEHNLFIEGSEFQSGPGVEAEELVGELRFGVAGRYRFTEAAHLELAWANTLRSDEFEQQDDSHAFGSFTLTANLQW